jgi:hypothetical protein
MDSTRSFISATIPAPGQPMAYEWRWATDDPVRSTEDVVVLHIPPIVSARHAVEDAIGDPARFSGSRAELS